MTAEVIAELPMYPAPAAVGAAYEQWLRRTLQLLDIDEHTPWKGSLEALWLHPHLLLAQTCGFPLITQLKEQVRVVGHPCFDLPHAQNGQHCSVLVVRADDPRELLAEYFDCRAAYNSLDSNSGMNLLRHALIPHVRQGRFFASAQATGSHRESIAQVARGEADVAAIDSVTFAYLTRYAPHEVAGVRVLGRTASSPTLPYITALQGPDPQVLRAAMNGALQALPEVALTLGVVAVREAELGDYGVLLRYRDEALGVVI